VICRGGGHRLFEGLDSTIEILEPAAPLETDAQGSTQVGQVRGLVGVVGGSGVYSAFEQLDRRLEHGLVLCPQGTLQDCGASNCQALIFSWQAEHR
jgi:hypothetical protein